MFTKLFSSITSSSIWNEDNNTRIVWITMLAMANKHGYISASVGGLAHEARLEREECEKALEVLCKPDPDSRSKEFEGRRVRVVDGGFELLNHAKYRAMRSEEERQEYMRSYMVEYRKKAKLTNNVSNNVNKVSECKPPLAQAEAEADTEAEEEVAIAPLSLNSKKAYKPPSIFVREWCKAYREFFGKEYHISDGKDERAATSLMGLSGAKVEEFIDIARKAWGLNGKNDFIKSNSVQISSFAAQLSRIQLAVGELNSKDQSTYKLRPFNQ